MVHSASYDQGMAANDLTEPLKKRVGGSLSRVPPLQRLAMLQRNLLMLRGGKWSPLKTMEPSFEKLLVLLVEQKTKGPDLNLQWPVRSEALLQTSS